ncbi:hypothetical protein FUA23_11225 [Neolewinella aurantiaca]|uniref:Uncharacterized protein n=1 Tax=Neolewinella aurantiaca TaxID=2602767 RepID=A0A5C7FUY2_9BACT|nr:hypothetical protein [Neolewinella aurantiaca]TXF89309.1 hypothetical protein FUA23_11225 [Neolewinella aurantiaca]
MRLITMLVTAVLLATCVHDTEDYNLFITESGTSLTYYIGCWEGASPKGYEDPWDRIRENFYGESECVRGGKFHDDPWERINEGFSGDGLTTGKGTDYYFMRERVTKMLFVVVSEEVAEEEDFWGENGTLFMVEGNEGVELTLVEVRGEIGRFAGSSGQSVFGVGIPEDWEPGLLVRGKAYLLDTKEMLPLVGAVIWTLKRPHPGPSFRGMGGLTRGIGETLNAIDYD